MATMMSAMFHVDPSSWLGKRLDDGRQECCSIGVALAYECRPNKGERLSPELQDYLAAESKEKVLSMFRRLQLEGADDGLLQYQIMDTQDFWTRYRDCVASVNAV